MTWTNIVVDDLREFKDTPYAMRQEVLYFKNCVSAIKFIREQIENTYDTVVIENLWLDFDLGEDENTKPFCMELALANSLAQEAGKQTVIVVRNLWIVTANTVGRQEIIALAGYFANNFQVVNPVDFGLINEVDW